MNTNPPKCCMGGHCYRPKSYCPNRHVKKGTGVKRKGDGFLSSREATPKKKNNTYTVNGTVQQGPEILTWRSDSEEG